MKNRIGIICLVIVALAAFSSVPRANADPLTVMALVGIASVAVFSSVDIVAGGAEDTKDLRAQDEAAAKLIAKADATDGAPEAGGGGVAAPAN
jgi:hypothetical protein